MATSLHAHYAEIDQILGTQAASCPHVVMRNGGDGSSAADDVVPAFEKCVSKREAE